MNLAVTADGRPVTVAVLRSLQDLASLRDAWDRVHSSKDSGFLSWEWLYTWTERFVRGERQLLVLAIYERSALVGIAPWYVDRVAYGPVRVREVAFLGTPEGGSDYLNVLASRGKERLVAGALLTILFGQLSSYWDTVRLSDVPADSTFLARFMSDLRHSGKHYATEEGAFCPTLHLPATFDLYLRQLSGHARAAYRRKMRALQAQGDVVHSVYRGKQEVLDGLGEFHTLYAKRWGRTHVSDDLFGLVRTYVERSSNGWHPELSLLRSGGRTVAGLFHFVRERVMYQYLMAIDRDFNRSLSVGSLTCAMNIQSAIERGFIEYDFLKREEDYKLQFTSSGRRSMNIRVHNRTVRSLLAWMVVTGSGLGKLLLR